MGGAEYDKYSQVTRGVAIACHSCDTDCFLVLMCWADYCSTISMLNIVEFCNEFAKEKKIILLFSLLLDKEHFEGVIQIKYTVMSAYNP